jgi:hypothetical protein
MVVYTLFVVMYMLIAQDMERRCAGSVSSYLPRVFMVLLVKAELVNQSRRDDTVRRKLVRSSRTTAPFSRYRISSFTTYHSQRILVLSSFLTLCLPELSLIKTRGAMWLARLFSRSLTRGFQRRSLPPKGSILDAVAHCCGQLRYIWLT